MTDLTLTANDGHELGETVENVAAICEGPHSPDNLRLAPVLTYVGKLTSSPASISQSDVQNILNAGWDEDAFHMRHSLQHSMPS